MNSKLIGVSFYLQSVPQRKAREKLRRAASGQKIEDLEDDVAFTYAVCGSI